MWGKSGENKLNKKRNNLYLCLLRFSVVANF